MPRVAKLRFFEDALAAARGARSLLDDKLRSAKHDLARAHDAVHAAALRVLAARSWSHARAGGRRARRLPRGDRRPGRG